MKQCTNLARQYPAFSLKLMFRFIKYCKIMPNGCIEWIGIIKNGYGEFTFQKKRWRAHRLAYIWANNIEDTSKQVNHTCNNRKCINIEHLYLSSQRQNTRDNVINGKSGRKTKDGRKLTYIEINEIKDKKNKGYKIYDLSREYKISSSVIYGIINGIVWSNEQNNLPTYVYKSTTKNKFFSRIRYLGKPIHCGTFNTPEEAYKAAIKKMNELKNQVK